MITKSDYDVEAGSLINEFGWKTVRGLIISDTAVMMFKIMNNVATQYPTSIFQQLRDVQELTLRDTYLNLQLPRMSTNTGHGRVSYQGVDAWNKIDQKIKWEPRSSHLDGFYSNNKMQLILLSPF